MTTNDINGIIRAANLKDRTDRLMLADALEDAGRDEESLLCRDSKHDLLFVGRSGRIRSVPRIDVIQGETEDGAPFGYVDGWFILWTCTDGKTLSWELDQDQEYVEGRFSRRKAEGVVSRRVRAGFAPSLRLVTGRDAE